MPIVNVGEQDSLLQPRTVVGTLSNVKVVSWPSGGVSVGSFEELGCQQATIALQVVEVDGVEEAIRNMDLSQLSLKEQV